MIHSVGFLTDVQKFMAAFTDEVLLAEFKTPRNKDLPSGFEQSWQSK